jgi:hypothetical protein
MSLASVLLPEPDGPTSRHRVEGQRMAARAALVGRGAEVVERQRRGAAGGVDRHVLAHVDGEGDHLAGTEVAGAAAGDAAARRCGVDLRAALGQTAQRRVGGIAGLVGSRVRPNLPNRRRKASATRIVRSILETDHKVIDLAYQSGFAPQPVLHHAFEPEVERDGRDEP